MYVIAQCVEFFPHSEEYCLTYQPGLSLKTNTGTNQSIARIWHDLLFVLHLT